MDAAAADPDVFEMIENMQADLHIEIDRADAAEATLDKLKRWLAAAQKQLDRPEMVATQVAIDAAGQDGDPFDHCNVCGIDRGDHDCVEGEEPGTCYLVPCEEHLIPVEGAGAVEVSVQTDALAAEDPDDLAVVQTVERLMKEATDAEAQRDEALEKLAAALEKLASFEYVEDTGDEPQYQMLCWNCDQQLTIRVHIYRIKCISTGEGVNDLALGDAANGATVCSECWQDSFEDDEDWVDMDADEDSDAE
jgi:hypothetical protein